MAEAPATLPQLMAARTEMAMLRTALAELRASGLTNIESMSASAAVCLQLLDRQIAALYRIASAVVPPLAVVLNVRRQGFRDNGLGKLREALAHRIGEVRRPAVGAASGG